MGTKAFVVAFVGKYNVFPVRSRVILSIPGSSYEFPSVLYASKLASVGHYSSSLWPGIGLYCIFANPVRSKCYSLELTLVRR